MTAPFLDRYCVGFDQFAEYLTGASDGIVKDASWAGAICAMDAEAIKTLARRMAKLRTMLSFSWSLTRQAHGRTAFLGGDYACGHAWPDRFAWRWIWAWLFGG
jgi:biotin/methionine sulfoxide reductase